MQSPVKKEYITQVFGANPGAYAQYGLKGHNGIDFRAFSPDGSRCYEGNKSEVFAPHGGQVVENSLDASYGWYVKIQDDSQGSVLAHFSSQSPFTVGSTVKQGQFVGYQGTTGNSTGIHLHWGYYPLPRNRQNGYNGYINQAGLYQAYGEETMSKLLTHLDVPNDDEAIKKLIEHLGEENGKSNWGKTGDKGGYLGSERKKNDQLMKEIALYKYDREESDKLIAQLRQDLAKCQARPDVTPGEPEMRVNGKNVSTQIVTANGTVTTTINYTPVSA